jgi:hypothetical protein
MEPPMSTFELTEPRRFFAGAFVDASAVRLAGVADYISADRLEPFGQYSELFIAKHLTDVRGKRQMSALGSEIGGQGVGLTPFLR